MLTFFSVTAHPAGNCHLLCSDTDAILIDASLSFAGEETAQRIAEVLAHRTLRAIVLSHSHYDHTTGLWWIHQRFPEVPIYAHPITLETFTRPGAMATIHSLCHHAAGLYLDAPERGLLPEDSFAALIPCFDGQTIPFGKGEAVFYFTPGHTRDSLSIDFPQEGVSWLCETLGYWDGNPNSAILPCYLSGYQSTLDAIDRILALGARRYILPHAHLLTAEQSAFFLSSSRAEVVVCADRIVSWYQEGLSEEEMLARFTQLYRTDSCNELQPLEAFLLNTRATLRITLKEQLGVTWPR